MPPVAWHLATQAKAVTPCSLPVLGTRPPLGIQDTRPSQAPPSGLLDPVGMCMPESRRVSSLWLYCRLSGLTPPPPSMAVRTTHAWQTPRPQPRPPSRPADSRIRLPAQCLHLDVQWRLEPAVARAEQWGPEAGSAGHPRLTAGPSSQSRSPEMLGLVPSSSKTLFPTHPESRGLCDGNPGALTPPSLPRWPRATTFFLMASPLNHGRRPDGLPTPPPPRPGRPPPACSHAAPGGTPSAPEPATAAVSLA